MRQLPPPDEHVILDRIRQFFVDHGIYSQNAALSRIALDAPFQQIKPLIDDLDFIDFIDECGLPPSQLKQWDWDFRTIGDFCRRLATCVTLPKIEDYRVLERQCDSAGLFLGIRRELQTRGEDPGEIAPSTRLEPYLIDHRQYFASLRFASNQTLPKLCVRDRGSIVVLVTLIALFTALIIVFESEMLNPVINLCLLGVLLFSWGWLFLAIRAYRKCFGYRFVTASWGEFKDFRDLVNALLGKPLRRRRTPVRQSQSAGIPTPSNDAKTTDRAFASRLIEDRHD